MSIKINWKQMIDIKTSTELMEMIKLYKAVKPDYASIDTETTGLHIINDKPFLLSFGFYNSTKYEGATFTYDFEHSTLSREDFFYALYKICKNMKYVVMHNTKYDMHMLTNIGFPYPFNNMTDSQIYIRLAHDNVPAKYGGVPLKLKPYAVKYITPKAKLFEQKLDKEKSDIATKCNNDLVKRFKTFPKPDEKYWKKGQTPKSWTKGTIDEFFKDVLRTPEDFPDPEMTRVYYEWKNSLPKQIQTRLHKHLVNAKEGSVTYDLLNRANVTEYAHYDIVYTLEAFNQCQPVAKYRKQEKAIKIEEDVIRPLYDMERVGFSFNLSYALESKDRLRNYILKKRNRLYELAGQNFKIGQHKLIASIIENKFDLDTDGTANDKLEALLTELPEEEFSTGREFIETLMELRTLEKWYSTYILKWIDTCEDGRVYTSIHQTGAVSGRVTSDFQQFPKKPLLDDEGNELFHPRRMIQVTGNGYDTIAFIDYSQIELRVQAIYTILVSGGDVNLCRAFMPFRCYHKTPEGKSITFDYKNPAHLDNFKNHVWYHNEDHKEWHPIDLHSATAKEAFPGIDESHNDWKSYRSKGKTANFACTYGANADTLERNGHSREIAVALHEGYKKAYPAIQDYRDYVYRYLRTKPYIEGLFGRRYYGINGHKGCNYLIQGSSADFLKLKITEVSNYLKDNKYKSRFQMNIHDELSFEIYKGEEHVIYELQKIMQILPGTLVPIVADLEITTSTWDQKEDM